jgi:hypothetical protein
MPSVAGSDFGKHKTVAVRAVIAFYFFFIFAKPANIEEKTWTTVISALRGMTFAA